MPSSSLTAAITPLIKAGNLTHKAPPHPSTSTTESICCIPQQAVDAQAGRRGSFLIFHRCTSYVGDSTGTTNTPLCNACKGWEFELTLNGTVKYVGAFRGLEVDMEQQWTKGSAELRRLVYMSKSGFSASEEQEKGKVGGSLNPTTEGSNSSSSSSNDVNDALPTYRFALYGGGDHIGVVSTIPAVAGQGTWRLLMNEPQKAKRTTHVMYISLPELVGHIIACGVAPENVPRALQQGKWGCVKLEFHTTGWRGPESMRSLNDGEPKEQWKEGWWYTWRNGMEIWVC